MRFLHLLFAIVTVSTIAKAQEFPEAIEDNSFYIEEAYNQDERVVQHISNGIYTMNAAHEFIYTFTQEWPVTTETHQLSYTLSYLSLTGQRLHGIGDIVINYRYQLSTKADWAPVAPRLSLILPTGDSDKGMGNGVFGIQFDIPASKRLSDQFIVHANAGGTILPSVKGIDLAGTEVKRTLTSYFIGASGIWLAERYDNLLLECLYNVQAGIDINGGIQYERSWLFNPAYRHAIEVDKLEIVPGIGFPVTISSSSTDFGVFLYLSFEHPY